MDPRIIEKLNSIGYESTNTLLTGNDLYNLFVEVLPKFPNLDLLYLGEVNMVSLQAMVNRMIELDPLINFPSITPSIKGDAAKRKTKMWILDLKYFQNIQYLWSFGREDTATTKRTFSDHKGCDDNDTNDHIGHSTGTKNRPRSCVSAWPLVLRHAVSHDSGTVAIGKKDMLTGLYHALQRQGPTVLARYVSDGLDGNPNRTMAKRKGADLDEQTVKMRK